MWTEEEFFSMTEIERSWVALGTAVLVMRGEEDASMLWESLFERITGVAVTPNGIEFQFEPRGTCTCTNDATNDNDSASDDAN